MNKIPMTEKQKNQIEEIYWKWFSKRHLKTFMEIIEQDTTLKKIIDEDLNLLEDNENLKAGRYNGVFPFVACHATTED